MVRLLLTAILVLSGPWAWATDGIRPNTPFKVPFTVDGKPVASRATIVVDDKGAATLCVLYASGDEILDAFYSLQRKDEPKPNPDPQPDPKPYPGPVMELWGIVVEESGERTAPQAIVMGSTAVRALFKDDRFRILDKDSKVDADMQPYLTRAKGMKLPALFLVEANGTVHFEGALPDSVPSMKVLVENVLKGGGK